VPAPSSAGATPTASGLAPTGPPARTLILAALYARVSTDKQEQEATIASQLDTLQRRAAAAGYTVPPEYVFCDDGWSGTRLDRPALDRLRDLAAEGAFTTVLVAAPDGPNPTLLS
jgi:site-specific DNA recombinase